MKILREVSILWSLFHILILFMLLYRSRYGKRKTFFLTGITMGPLIFLNVAGLVVYGHVVMGQVFILTCTLPSLLFFWFVSKDKKGRFFFTFCVADTVAFWIIVVTNLLDFYFGGNRCILMLVSRLILFPLVEWLAVRYLRKPYLELQESVAEGWGVFAGMTALYYLLLAVKASFPTLITERPQELPALLLILALMPMTYATIFSALYRQLLLYRKQESERILSEQKHGLEARLENQQRIRKLKHDMRGHTVMLAGLLSAGKYQEAENYLKDMEQETEPLLHPFSANPYVNSVLGYYYQKFWELHTVLKTEIQVGEELPYMELCQILTNGLENAWEASAALPQEERAASVQMRYSRDYLIIRIKNRCRSSLTVERGTTPKSSKKEQGHGFGLRTVQEAAARLDGEAFVYTDSGNFVLDVMVRTKET